MIIIIYPGNIDHDVDRGVECKHEMVYLGENLSPCWPLHKLAVFDHLVGLVGVGDQLGGVAADEDHHYGGEEGGHGIVSSVSASN